MFYDRVMVKIIVYTTDVKIINMMNETGYYPFVDSVHKGDEKYFEEKCQDGYGFNLEYIEEEWIWSFCQNHHADFYIWDDNVKDLDQLLNYFVDSLNGFPFADKKGVNELYPLGHVEVKKAEDVVMDPYASKLFDEILKNPKLDIKDLPPMEWIEPIAEEDGYLLTIRMVGKTMFYQVDRPYTDLPFTVYTKEFHENGHLDFFTSLFGSAAWGSSKHDVAFLKHFWTHFGMQGEFDMNKLLKDRIDSCYPPELKAEPEVYRRTIDEVLVSPVDKFY